MDSPFTPYLVTCICAALVAVCSFKLLRRPKVSRVCLNKDRVLLRACNKLDHIPAVGQSSLLASYWFTKGLEVDLPRFVQEGYDKYKSGVFRVPNLTHWIVCLHRNDLDHVARVPENHLSFNQATESSFKTEYTLGMKMDDLHHLSLIRSHLTRNLSVLYADVRDEITAACDEFLNPKHDVKAISVLHVSLRIVCRANNRVFVGLPLCRDPDWLNLNINLPRAIMNEARILRFSPNFMVPLVSKFITNLSGRTSRRVSLLGPVVKDRLQHMEAEDVDWCDKRNKPNDVLQWWLDISEEKTCLPLLTRRMIIINFVAINVCSHISILSQVLLNLAENPQYIQELRDEVEAVVSKHGWTKEAIPEKRKVDSFLKETQRFEGISVLDLTRKAMRDVTLADGTFIPQGTILAFPMYAMHHDDAVYENPSIFEPFRFADMRNKEFEGSRHQMVTIAPDMLSFGLGVHACPARFFAATVLKTMLARIVMSYDVKLEDAKSRPSSLHVGFSIVPNPAAKVMFRNRVN
ncbi:cytochrome P450 [Pisolithus marmoratus]|nr:cytochrome P450 [Pisolithus marmoratus]